MGIPKLTGGPGQKFVKKDMTNSEVNDTKNQNNGPSATTSTPASSTGDVNNTTGSKSLVANYSDNSSLEDGQISRGAPSPTDSNKGCSSSPVGAGGALEMEVDEDGASVQSTT